MTVQPTTSTRTVHRFDVEPTGALTAVPVHGSSQVLHVEAVPSKGQPKIRLWIEHDPAAAEATRYFQLVTTGAPLPAGALHVGTVFLPRVGKAFHVYELPTAATVPDTLAELMDGPWEG